MQDAESKKIERALKSVFDWRASLYSVIIKNLYVRIILHRSFSFSPSFIHIFMFSNHKSHLHCLIKSVRSSTRVRKCLISSIYFTSTSLLLHQPFPLSISKNIKNTFFYFNLLTILPMDSTLIHHYYKF